MDFINEGRVIPAKAGIHVKTGFWIKPVLGRIGNPCFLLGGVMTEDR